MTRACRAYSYSHRPDPHGGGDEKCFLSSLCIPSPFARSPPPSFPERPKILFCPSFITLSTCFLRRSHTSCPKDDPAMLRCFFHTPKQLFGYSKKTFERPQIRGRFLSIVSGFPLPSIIVPTARASLFVYHADRGGPAVNDALSLPPRHPVCFASQILIHRRGFFPFTSTF